MLAFCTSTFVFKKTPAPEDSPKAALSGPWRNSKSLQRSFPEPVLRDRLQHFRMAEINSAQGSDAVALQSGSHGNGGQGPHKACHFCRKAASDQRHVWRIPRLCDPLNEQGAIIVGEAKAKSRRRKEILSSHPRCICCTNPNATTIEHMPPRGLFRDKQRPSGWEFPTCSDCNDGSRGADAVAQMLSLIQPFEEEGWQFEQMKRVLPAVSKYAPRAYQEITSNEKAKSRWVKNRGLLRDVVEVKADGPSTVTHLDAFAGKIALAVFAELMGRPIELDGTLFTQWYLNAGLSEEAYHGHLSILPSFSELRQGKKTSAGQFWLHYNTDLKSIVAALIVFHGNLSVMAIASDGEQYKNALVEVLSDISGPNRPGSNLLHPIDLKLKDLRDK